jgi:crotonobetainyl-CoA:carnitine CoA-transferase CaiB-like acyl-CoA transferase
MRRVMPLSGVRILDLTTVLMGPYATQLLGDFGADVIKIEAANGDSVRGIGPMRHKGMGAAFLAVNRNKRSIVIDLKRPQGRELLLDMARRADVLVYNLRPHVMEKLGLAYEAFAEVNPALLYVGVYGYGRRGRYATRPAYDDLIQAMTAIPSLYSQSSGNDPRYVPFPVVDRFVGMYAALVVASALYERKNSGKGQRIDVPMFETMTSVVLGDHIGGRGFVPPLGPPGYARQLSRSRRPFPTSDGYLAILPYNDEQWRRFFRAVGRLEAFEKDPRFADIGLRTRNIDALYDIVAKILLTRTTSEWLKVMAEADIPATPLYTLDDVFDDPHLQEVGFFRECEHPSEGRVLSMRVPSEWSRTQPDYNRPAPRHGADYRDILQDMGVSQERIAALTASQVVMQPAGAEE